MAHNPHLKTLEVDILYHFGLNTKEHDMKKIFGGVRRTGRYKSYSSGALSWFPALFVCVGGSRMRMVQLASYMHQQLEIELPPGQMPINLATNTDRFVLFKVGQVLIADHGIGVPSLCVMLHELLKILRYAGCDDVILMRIGTSGGLGKSREALQQYWGLLGMCSKEQFLKIVLGKRIRRPAVLDANIVEELLNQARTDEPYRVTRGSTLCTDDFYEGQGRLDGIFCEYGHEEKMCFLKYLYDHGVRNIEMESLGFAAICHHSGHKCAVICATMLDRFQEDQLTLTPGVYQEWELRPSILVARFIRKKLGLDK